MPLLEIFALYLKLDEKMLCLITAITVAFKRL